MTRKQWDLLNQTISTALTMCKGRITDYKVKGLNPAMYEGWLREAEAARTELGSIGARMPHEVWSKQEVA